MSNYLTMKYKEIAYNLGFTERQVRGWINNNCKNKLRKFNSDYFKEITTPNQAYWLGFIYADGWVVCNYKHRNYELGIELCDIDEQQLIDFNNELGGVHTIIHKHYEKYICDYKNISIVDTVCIRIYSKQIITDLISHNVLENKTLKKEYSIVDDSLFFDFLRGYIDGDGCIYNNKDFKKSQVHITSSHDNILLYLKEKLLLYNIECYVYKEKDRKYRLCIKNKDIIRFLDMIYYNSSVQKLNRKYEKYLLLKGSLN